MTRARLYEGARPIRRAEYERMAQLGMFDGERVELIRGVIVQMSPKGTRHAAALGWLNELFVRGLAGRAKVRIQSPFAASDGSEPEPDVVLVPVADYRGAHPTRALLVIEVADSSLTFDRTEKASLYAESGVPEYWIVNVRDGLVEVHDQIVAGAYTRVLPYKAGARVAPQAFSDLTITVDDVFG